MLRQTTLFDLIDATSSAESAAGSLPYNSQDGQPEDQSGRGVVPANHSPQRGSKKERKTKDTYGRKCSGLSGSADLTRSLVSRLRQQLDTVGSMEYSQTWKEKATPAGRLYWEHTASAPRINDKDCTGWPTPRAEDGGKSQRSAEGVAKEIERKGPTNELGIAAQLAPWPSPTALSFNESHQPGNNRYTNAVTNLVGSESSLNKAALCSLAGWCSPASRDHKDTPGMATTGVNPDGSIRLRVDQLPRQVQLTPGSTSTSSTAQTANRGVLDAAFSRWLMGFPATWDEASPSWQSWCEVQERIASGD